MSESLFQITCPSCESVFAVTDPELVGQIIACPKCGGMTPVAPPEDAEDAGNNENSEGVENAENEAIGRDAEALPDGETAQNGRLKENASNVEERGERGTGEDGRFGENGKNSESAEAESGDGVPLERSRSGGKLVAGGIALALAGALAFWGARGVNNESSPISETDVETQKSENDEYAADGEGGEDGEDASNKSQDDVGGFAPFAVEERTGDKTEEAQETQGVWRTDEAALEDGEDAAFGGIGEDGANESKSGDAQDESVATNVDGETTPLEGFGIENDGETTLDLNETAETGEVGEVGKNSKDGKNGEDSENNEDSETDESSKTGESGENGASGDGENDLSSGEQTDVLGGLGELGDLDEDAALDLGETDASESDDEGTAEGEKLAGSNATTGFNEADFERANRNDDSENADESAEVDWSAVASTTSPTLQGALPTLRRERKEIDVDARLALPIKSIEFPSSPVAAIRLLSEFTGVSIVPDLDAFVLTRPATGLTLDLALRDTTAGEALEKVAELLNWEVCKEKDRVLIRPTGYNPETLVEERFDVADLTPPSDAASDATRLEMFELPNNLTPETLATMIKSLVAPETWSDNGGSATLKVNESTLVISQNAQNREKIRALLEGLRAIRGLEPQGDAAPERIIPEKLGWEKLLKKTTFVPLNPLALQNAVEILEKSQKLQVFWDDATLIEAGVGRDATTAAKVENGTVDAVLSEILEPLNATYLILGENLIFATSKSAAETYQTVEFFSLVGENGERPTLAEARALVEEIKMTIAPGGLEAIDDASTNKSAINREDEAIAKAEGVGEEAAIREEGEVEKIGEIGELDEAGGVGEVEGVSEGALSVAFGEERQETAFSESTPNEQNAAIWLDVESSCLIIRQSQPKQRVLRRWLAARLADVPNAEEEN